MIPPVFLEVHVQKVIIGTDDYETGQCYDNDKGCNWYMIKDGIRFDYVLIEGDDGKSDRCAKPTYLCHEDPSYEICREYLDDGHEK